MSENVYSHAGDLGDVIFACPTIRALGGGTLILSHKPGKTCHEMTKEKAESLRSLLILQPYIENVIFCTENCHETNLDGFRNHYRNGRNLADCHLSTHGLGPEHREAAWLTVEPIKIADVIINRSSRYHGAFPWDRVLSKYKDRIAFVGYEDEYYAFISEFGEVPYHPTQNILELAEVIAGSQWFIGNQSLGNALSEGLKHNTILEVHPGCWSSCIFPRHGLIVAYLNDYIELPNLYGDES